MSMDTKQKQAIESVNKIDGIANAKARSRAMLDRTLPICGLAATILLGVPSQARADLPPVYQQCASVEANPSAAIAACSAIIRSGRDSGHNLAVSLTNRGIGWANENQLDRAIADLDQAIWHDPNYARAYNARGLAHARKGNLDQAINDLDQAAAIS
jgi:tetratricopeptide (TPR) repeat protein